MALLSEGKEKKECASCSNFDETKAKHEACKLTSRAYTACVSREDRPFWTSREQAGQSGEETKKEIPPHYSSHECRNERPDYTPGSIVTKRIKRIEDLVSAHWSYQEKLLSAGQDKSQTFTWEQVMEMRKWDYCSSAKHFYGHGYEDALSNQGEMESQSKPEKDIRHKLGGHPWATKK